MFAAAGLMLATPSCKKGENDPGLSLSSRTARMAGEWDVSSSSSTSGYSYDDVTFSNSTEYNGTVSTSTSTTTQGSSSSSSSTTRNVSEYSYIINKDGTYDMTYNYTYQTTDDNGWTTTVTDHTITSSESGTWSFLGKAKGEFKNKERAIFNTLASDWKHDESYVTTDNGTGTQIDDGTSGSQDIETYSHGEVTMVVEIDQLKGKEMIWMASFEGTSTDKNTQGATTTTTVYTSTGSGTTTLTHR